MSNFNLSKAQTWLKWMWQTQTLTHQQNRELADLIHAIDAELQPYTLTTEGFNRHLKNFALNAAKGWNPNWFPLMDIWNSTVTPPPPCLHEWVSDGFVGPYWSYSCVKCGKEDLRP